MRNRVVTSCLVGVGMLAMTAMTFAQEDKPAKSAKPETGMEAEPAQNAPSAK